MNSEREYLSRKRLTFALLLAGAAAGGLTGCSSSSSPAPVGSPPPSPPANPPSDPTVLTGIFTDSAVANIGYRTATQEDVTNEDGEFNYVDGESVVFFIGDLELPPVAAAPVVTPFEIAATDQQDDPIVVNIARLLQSLDANGAPDDGIQIPDAAAASAGEVDFSLPPGEFENLANVVNLVANSGSVTTALVSTESALEHLLGTLSQVLVGSWRYEEADTNLVLSFLPNGEYMLGEVGQAEGSGFPGIEHGTFTWHPISGEITFNEIIWDTNGDWGFSDISESHGSGTAAKLAMSADGTEVLFTENDEHDGPTFTRIATGTGSVVGSWTFTELAGDGVGTSLVVATFLEDGKYFIAQDGAAEIGYDEGAGVEYGVYEWDADTGAISILEIIEDTNGEWGLSGLYQNQDESLLLQPGNKRLNMIEGEDEIYFGEVCADCEIPDWS